MGKDPAGGGSIVSVPPVSEEFETVLKCFLMFLFSSSFLSSASVDLQLPQVEGGAAIAPAELPPEPKPKFKERIITSLGDEGGPASFRKNKAQNSKSRSLRQRDNDD